MKARRTRIARVVADKTLKSGVTKSLSRDIAAYLLSEGRTGELESVMRDVQADWAQAGIVEVIASSTHPLTAAIRADIKRQVTGLYPKAKRIIVTERHDPEVIGGVKLDFADRQLDLSVEARLNQFKELTANGKSERK